MRVSQLFGRTLRHAPREEESVNAKLLIQGGFIRKLLAGVYTFLPLGLRVMKKLEAIIREEMNRTGAQEILMPALHPIENYHRTGRANLDILFSVGPSPTNKLVLGQSHEEVITPLVKECTRKSYRDYPIALYQFQTKFRNEFRTKSGILRVREFMMKDLYSFHTTQEDFERYYSRVEKSYERIFAISGIGDNTYLTMASGGTFSEYSHEFQTITSAGEDTIYLCDACRVATNEEMINDPPRCHRCGNETLHRKKSIEVGNIFPLKNRFSNVFHLTFVNERGEEKPIIMGCYGIGLSRLLGTIVEIHHDPRGIVWPETVAPFDLHLLVLGGKPEIRKQGDRLETALHEQGIDVLYDDREESAGVKLMDADLIGIPLRAIISPKTGSQIEMKERREKTSRLVNEQQLLEKITISHRSRTYVQ